MSGMETDSMDIGRRSRTSGQLLKGMKMIRHKGRLTFVEDIGKEESIDRT